jgi:hypothetical protein
MSFGNALNETAREADVFRMFARGKGFLATVKVHDASIRLWYRVLSCSKLKVLLERCHCTAATMLDCRMKCCSTLGQVETSFRYGMALDFIAMSFIFSNLRIFWVFLYFFRPCIDVGVRSIFSPMFWLKVLDPGILHGL